MMVYVAVMNYVVKGYENFPHIVVVGMFRTKDSAKKALCRRCELLESDINYTVKEMMVSEQWIE